MDNNRLTSWLEKIYHTQDEEISCSECLDQVSHYVQVELASQDAAAESPQVAQHLDQCAACQEEYQTLLDIGRLENEGGLPSPSELGKLIP